LRGASASAWLKPGGRPRLAGRGGGQATGRWRTSQAGRSCPPPPPLPSAFAIKNFFLKKKLCYRWSDIQFLKIVVADGSGPFPSGLGRMVHSASLSQWREGRHSYLDEVRHPPPGQAAEELSCAQQYNTQLLVYLLLYYLQVWLSMGSPRKDRLRISKISPTPCKLQAKCLSV
jgi:hypothetical protein